MSNTIQSGDLCQLLGRMGGAAFFDDAATGSTATSIVCASAKPVAGSYVGGMLRFITGALAGQEQQVTANTSAAFTVASAFTAVPGVGDVFIIIQKIEVQVTAPENIAQVGGVAQTGADWTPLLQGAAVKQGTLTDRSGSITTGGAAQTLAAVNASRHYLLIQNPLSATTQGIATAESLFFNFTATSVESEPSIELAPGDIFTMEGSAISTELISVVAATTGHKWAAKEM